MNTAQKKEMLTNLKKKNFRFISSASLDKSIEGLDAIDTASGVSLEKRRKKVRAKIVAANPG